MLGNKPMRRLPLEGTSNTRDIGGYPCADGVVAWKTFVRSDNPGALTPADLDYLRNYGIHKVVDLRRHDEAKQTPSVLASADGFEVHNISIGNVMKFHDFQGDVPGSMAGLYMNILDDSKQEIAQVMQIMASADGGVLFHCAVGKDRTGVIAMLLLSLAEVSDADIVADYSVTEIYMREIYKAQSEVFMTEDIPDYILRSNPASMERVLRHLRETYGNTKDYLKLIGLSQQEIAALKARLLQPN